MLTQALQKIGHHWWASCGPDAGPQGRNSGKPIPGYGLGHFMDFSFGEIRKQRHKWRFVLHISHFGRKPCLFFAAFRFTRSAGWFRDIGQLVPPLRPEHRIPGAIVVLTGLHPRHWDAVVSDQCGDAKYDDIICNPAGKGYGMRIQKGNDGFAPLSWGQQPVGPVIPVNRT